MNAKEARARRVVGRPRRTYLPLEGQRRKPSDYEVVSTSLLYYPERGFEVPTPVWQHYLKHQPGARAAGVDWEAFVDPAATTYSSYVAARRDQEAFLDRAFARSAAPLAPELEPLLALISAWRFPLHGLQMTAAYVGALAPTGRVTITCALQAADELRRIQRLCQWLARSGKSLSELDALGRELWQQHPAFQPLRRAIEELLVTYDWMEALVSLNGALKPLLDRLWFEHVVASARNRDETLEQMLKSFAEDGRWHEAWFGELMRLVRAGAAEQASALGGLCRARTQAALQALKALSPLLDGVLTVSATRVVEELGSSLRAVQAGWGEV